MSSIKLWIVGVALTGAVALVSTRLRARASEALRGWLRRFYAWVFLRLPSILLSQIDFGSLSLNQETDLMFSLGQIVYHLVRIEEVLLPDAGLGAEKKARVLAKLRQFGIPDCLSDLASKMIDDAVTAMNGEARDALKTYGAEPGK